MMEFDSLKLENQICFPLYATSRLIMREYKPYLDRLEITYPQYLVLMVLWETDQVPINDISRKLILNTNTLTPLLKRMEMQGLVSRKRLNEDGRKVIIQLTEKGKAMRVEAVKIPQKLAEGLISETMTIAGLAQLKRQLDLLLKYLVEKDKAV